MREKDIQTLFGKHLKERAPERSGAYELKMARGTSIPFKAVKPHQSAALKCAKRGGVYHKIQDAPLRAAGNAGFMRFGLPKPFDCLFIRDAEAFVVVVFYKPRMPKEAIFIDIEEFEAEEARSTRKSLTETRAREISSRIEIL